ncbi:hypothetical protein LDG_7614 [Legionella drancourtii LLAP12]|uniref:Uncharacterized protein n=1 Tax=Legionella drancourtii LLAP12 TaxID=658187 RepID=G9EQR2_9GAMM|nr:hypothetical protein LDG_7614 [Legionella drancourtii LLAP12]
MPALQQGKIPFAVSYSIFPEVGLRAQINAPKIKMQENLEKSI